MQQGRCTYKLKLLKYAQDLYNFKSTKTPEWRRRSGHRHPHLTKNLFSDDNHWERETQFSTMEHL